MVAVPCMRSANSNLNEQLSGLRWRQAVDGSVLNNLKFDTAMVISGLTVPVMFVMLTV
jgi:hypothetical protein